ncbi:MAG TPA: hypothetical protein VKH19_07595 [Gemmatimonadaceae bacterium]|nr:hypothetical protein [Gemmatimonadaceae bacterium]
MSERRIVFTTDDGGEIEVRWTEGARKITVEFEERPAVNDGIALGAAQAPVSTGESAGPENPAGASRTHSDSVTPAPEPPKVSE